MFAKLKKKIQDEAQTTVASPSDPEKKPGKTPTSPGPMGPGLASPVSKEYPGAEPGSHPLSHGNSRGQIFTHGRNGSDFSQDSLGSRTSSVNDLAKEGTTKEEVLAMLLKRTEQVKKLEGKISDLAAMIKERNRQIDKLETTLQKQQETAQQQLTDMTGKYGAEKNKVADGFAAAVGQREEEIKLTVQKRLQSLEKSKATLEAKLQKAEEYRDKFYKQVDEKDELKGLASQELSKIKHMLLLTKDELKEKTSRVETAEKRVNNQEEEIHSLMEQIGILTTKTENEEETNCSLTRRLEKTQKTVDDANVRLAEMTQKLTEGVAEKTVLHQKNSKLQAAYKTLETDAELAKQKSKSEFNSKSEHVLHLQERVNTLEQRLQTGELSGDDRVKALEAEYTTLEKKLNETREQLLQSRSSSNQQIAIVEEQLSLNKFKLAEQSDVLCRCQKQLEDAQSSLQKEGDSWKSKLQMALLEINDKEKLLDLQKQNQNVEISRLRSNSDQLEEGYKLQVQQLKSQLESVDRQREKERQTTQQKIAKLETGQEDWLEREIDTERQITKLEEDLHKTKVEASEREKEAIALRKKLQISQKKLEELEQKLRRQDTAGSNYESVLATLQSELSSSTQEKDDLMLRNAELSQTLEAHKQRSVDELAETRHELKHRDAAVAGLEQSLEDLQAELQQKRQKIQSLEQQQGAALDKIQSEELTNMRAKMENYDEQLGDKNKTIKMLQQRLTDLKKTLQRELKIQSLPNDDPADRLVSSANSHDIPDSSHLATNGVPTSLTGEVTRETVARAVMDIAEMKPHHHVSKSSYSHHSKGTRGVYARPYPPDVYKYSGFSNFVGAFPLAPGQSSSDCPMCKVGIIDVNYEYLKHVVLKFMLSKEHEAVHLIKAVAMLLRFSPEEQRLIKDTLEWKMSWFGTRPQVGSGQKSKVIPSTF